ncbi:MAG: beta-N-acetylhexosaminidase [Leptospirales bacterium]
MKGSRSASFLPWGQWLWVSLPSERLTEEDSRWLREIRPAGVVLFSENGRDADCVRHLISEIREILSPDDVWIAIDQEGGRVERLKKGVPLLQPMRDLGGTGDPVPVFDAAFQLGKKLRQIGVDVDFAPVLDVDSNPANPVIGDRAFSNDAWKVQKLGMAFAHGLTAAGIVPCGKHFPGHGDTVLDSHFDLPTVDAPETVLVGREWLPFEHAVFQGIPLIMTAHVRYPAIDPRWPATMSSRILKGILRKRFGFSGVLLSDDLSMAGVGAHFPLPMIVERSLRATCDGLLVLKNRERATETLEIIRRLASGDPAFWEGRLKRSLDRLGRLRMTIRQERTHVDG